MDYEYSHALLLGLLHRRIEQWTAVAISMDAESIKWPATEIYTTSSRVYRRLANELADAVRFIEDQGAEPTDDQVWEDATKRVRPGEDTGLFCGVIPDGRDQ